MYSVEPLELELTSQHVQRWICCNCKQSFDEYEDQLQHRYLEHKENFCRHCKRFMNTPFMRELHEKDCLKYQKALRQIQNLCQRSSLLRQIQNLCQRSSL